MCTCGVFITAEHIVVASNMKVNELLCYSAGAYQCATKNALKTFLLDFYQDQEIAEAKRVMYDDYKDILGKPPARRGSTNRSEAEADMNDIMDALEKMDKKGNLPEYMAKNMSRFPFIKPGTQNPTVKSNVVKSSSDENEDNRFLKLEKAVESLTELVTSSLISNSTSGTTMPRPTYASAASLPPLPERSFSTRKNLPSNDRTSSQNNLFRPVVQPRSTRGRTQGQMGRNSTAVGTNKNSAAGLQGAPLPSRDFFISRAMKGTTVEKVREHLRCCDIDVRDLTVISHNEAKFTSFKLTVPISEISKVIDPDNWPTGINVRKYYNRREQPRKDAVLQVAGDDSDDGDIASSDIDDI